MTDPTEARQMLLAAERAAAASDFATAERLLRDAADMQERTLGPDHPDLANTFNNLGVVCEYANRRGEAEPFYRRAYTIAQKAFPPDHPFVATSRKNLEELCQLLGKRVDEIDAFGSEKDGDNLSTPEPSPIEPPESKPPTLASPTIAPTTIKAPPPAPPLRLELDTPSPAPARVPAAVPSPPPARVSAKVPSPPSVRAPAAVPVPRDEPQPSRALSLGAITVVAIAIAIIVIGWIAWPSRSEPARTETAQPSTASESTASGSTRPGSTPSTSTPSASTAPASPAPPTAASTPTAAPEAPAPAPRTPDPPPDARTSSPRTTGKTAASTSLEITDARLCRTLSTRGEWRCDPIGSPVTSGAISFYTRITSPRPTKVQHRWYQGETLRQNVTLSVQPNGKGYRTFSRLTVGPDRAGQWRVELRAEDGRVLREERFTVK